eukprot:TRINITY_DN1120_c1_g1_i2.p1 TRINITY_DN1120_c1_g1~~TRINITY_DN1120_c1_g1_i2.p1  ORF type:complete len:209 (+),score=73.03 TRINITY_DN1120_c1_g1_i2:89-715(+)
MQFALVSIAMSSRVYTLSTHLSIASRRLFNSLRPMLSNYTEESLSREIAKLESLLGPIPDEMEMPVVYKPALSETPQHNQNLDKFLHISFQEEKEKEEEKSQTEKEITKTPVRNLSKNKAKQIPISESTPSISSPLTTQTPNSTPSSNTKNPSKQKQEHTTTPSTTPAGKRQQESKQTPTISDFFSLLTGRNNSNFDTFDTPSKKMRK